MPEKEKPELPIPPRSVEDAVRFFLDGDDKKAAIRYLQAHPDDTAEFCLQVRDSYGKNDTATPFLKLSGLIQDLLKAGQVSGVSAQVEGVKGKQRKEIGGKIPLLDRFLREGEDYAIKLYDYLKKTGRSGVILIKGHDGDEIVGRYFVGDSFGRNAGSGERIITRFIQIDGKPVGKLEVRERNSLIIDQRFEANPGVDVFSADDLEKEMGKSE